MEELVAANEAAEVEAAREAAAAAAADRGKLPVKAEPGAFQNLAAAAAMVCAGTVRRRVAAAQACLWRRDSAACSASGPCCFELAAPCVAQQLQG